MDSIKDAEAKKAICREIIEFAKTSKKKSVAERFGKTVDEPKKGVERDSEDEIGSLIGKLIGGQR
jgi:hypothetical protein